MLLIIDFNCILINNIKKNKNKAIRHKINDTVTQVICCVKVGT